MLGLPLSSLSAMVGAVVRPSTVKLDDDAATLVEAATAVARRAGWPLPRQLDWFVETNIPREVGLSGSSAIVLGAIETLAQLVGVDHDPDIFAAMALSAETEVLGWTAGLQDRVLQAHNRPLLMDFDPWLMDEVDGWPVGRYTPVDPSLLPPVLFVAYRAELGEPSHRALSKRKSRPDQVQAVMDDSARLARTAHASLLEGDLATFGDAMNRSFRNRREVFDVDAGQVELVESYASLPGVAANSAGSGGSVAGAVVSDDADAAVDRIQALATRRGHGLVVWNTAAS